MEGFSGGTKVNQEGDGYEGDTTDNDSDPGGEGNDKGVIEKIFDDFTETLVADLVGPGTDEADTAVEGEDGEKQKDEDERESGSISVTGHNVGGIGPMHMAIEYTDEAGKTSTLSAGPEGGKLVSEPNRASDAPEKNSTIGRVTPPEGVTTNDYINELRRADGKYCDCADYDLFPGVSDSYNSNSYVRGLIEATGGKASVNFGNYYGGNDPLPERYFK
ncbi:MAG: hypothetical protein COX62_08630 [Deltaproteobacteria bacterium CG_4_10_14_0_2_um_filter_43_8]|nr:MAG: hypothetical protein COV43_08760 [Deltaproteobacteria bacterium CG11_big_fil_rev_8_21_14_0_20_42_23]PJA18432.1 MAG: hypothetical protein COX62_08630 [Deltaproteobacteria bacterium CG_4_10_14_0_2_um_filter_43_8]PJC64912.1 MAG: hypothetical protein CO021_01645 [Deltaproteobacteria bacterium CG_4_9_14_0_2_um_filter_42_21]